MPKNPQNDHVSVLAASRKKQAAPEHLLQTHSTFSMLLMVSMVMSKLGKMNLICVILGVISGAYYQAKVDDIDELKQHLTWLGAKRDQ